VTALLALQGLGKDYGARKAVVSLDLEVQAGEIFGLLGPNGAGKTTTISMVSGVVTPTRGKAIVAGHDVCTAANAARASVGLVPQDLAIYEDLTARENLAFFGSLHGLRGGTLRDRLAWALDLSGLAGRADEPAKQFSGGMKRRLNLAAGLLHEPKLLILDEPTVGVDPQSRNHIFEAILALRKAGMTILYTSHYLEEVQALCDRIAILDGGRLIAQGKVGELLAAHAEVGFEVEVEGEEFAITTALAMAAAFAELDRHGHTLHVAPTGPLAPVINAIEGAGVRIVTIHTRRPDLEAVFLELTGKSLRDAE